MNSASPQEIALRILRDFEVVCTKLKGKAVVLSDGRAGTVDGVSLDELHGLRISITGHEGEWPISTVKLGEASIADAHPQTSSPL